MKTLIISTLGLAALFVAPTPASAQVTLVEGGHQLIQHVDSAVPLHPSQTQIETDNTDGQIESIAVDPNNGDMYVQVSNLGGAAPSVTTSIYKVVPGGVVTPVNVNTGFGIVGRGADMHWDKTRNLLVTMDSNFQPAAGGPAGRIATVNPAGGATGTYAPFPFGGATFGMDFSQGIGDVPQGDVVFTHDFGSEILSADNGGGTALHLANGTFSGGGDDMVVQPDGDWVWIGDFTTPIYSISPNAGHANGPTALDIQTVFTNAGLPFVFGSRSTVCPSCGDIYISYSGGLGGSGIFRIDEALTTATLLLTVGGAPQQAQTEGLQDLTVGPSSVGFGTSMSCYFTVHDPQTRGEEVWEVTLPECEVPECFLVIGPGSGNGPFQYAPGSHDFTTQVGDVASWYPVLLDEIPVFDIDEMFATQSVAPRTLRGAPGATGSAGHINGMINEVPPDVIEPVEFHVQVLMWNPTVFPGQPEQFTHGLAVRVYPSGRVITVPYGETTGMEVWAENFLGADGRPKVRFPFSIPGM